MLRLIRKSGPTPPDDLGSVPLSDIEACLCDRLLDEREGVVHAINALLFLAAQHRASDAHLEPWGPTTAVRFRIDGVLQDVAQLPGAAHPRLLSRIKVLAKLTVYEKETPQDGRIDSQAAGIPHDVRVSTFPTVHGEKAVLRILGTQDRVFTLNDLGFSAPILEGLRQRIARPQGTLLFTGPSSSGKTTTIYSLLREVLEQRNPRPHVITLEDPVEYRLSGVAQTEIAGHRGMTFAAALRAALRQDPDVIMVGEIRDVETAQTTVQAGLTGHLVFSTIHSGTAAGVFARLLEMDLEPFIVASSMSAVVAQRLLRQVCPSCTKPYEPDPDLLLAYAMEPDAAHVRGEGCEACQGLGYRGRTAVGELLGMDKTLADLILERPRTSDIESYAQSCGMKPLLEAALDKVRDGSTTLEEVKHVLPPPL